MSEGEQGEGTVASALEWIKRLFSAAAVLHLLARGLRLPRSKWLAHALDAYHDLMTPIVDWTVGLIPWLFGYHFTATARDWIVVYLLFASTELRMWERHSRKYRQSFQSTSDFKWLLALFFVAWPFFLTFDTWRQLRQRRTTYKEISLGRLLWIGFPGSFMIELATVLGVVALAVALNAADVLL